MRFRRPLDEEPEVNLIPLIDILLVVLIFLAVSTTYSRYAELKIELPTADATQPTVRPNEINVAVTADGRYALERKLIGSLSSVCQELGVLVVAEGIETLEERAVADAAGCHLAQGYLFGKPSAEFAVPAQHRSGGLALAV
jgi:biopolymer transport protein ExbD